MQMAVWIIIAFMIGASDGAIWPSLLALAYIIYVLGWKKGEEE